MKKENNVLKAKREKIQEIDQKEIKKEIEKETEIQGKRIIEMIVAVDQEMRKAKRNIVIYKNIKIL